MMYKILKLDEDKWTKFEFIHYYPGEFSTLAIRTTVVPIRILIHGRADKDSYPHDRHNQYIMLRL